MRFYLISDNIDTQKGMRLAGIEGVVVHGKKEFEMTLDVCLKDESVGIILITEVLAALIPRRLRPPALGR